VSAEEDISIFSSFAPHGRCGLTHQLEDEDVVQIVKQKVTTGGEEGKGRFKSTSTKGPARIADREKKAALKT
jgi:hypothetical protein